MNVSGVQIFFFYGAFWGNLGIYKRLLIIASTKTKTPLKSKILKHYYIYVSHKQRKYKIFSKFLSL